MKRTMALVSLALMLHLSLAGAFAPVAAQTASSSAPESAATSDSGSGFTTEQLEQMVAPIALYPDSLLTQILMAATYPLEVVQADRFMREHADLKDDALDEALKDQDWDTSVKGLCTLPDVLEQMSDNLEWTQDLGDAFLGQQDELLDTVQQMRGKANDAGNLKTTEQQVVTVQQDKIIVIESPQPEIIYVPTYSPTVVYGPSWFYPSYYYPRFYYPPPPGVGLITFGVGVAVGAAIWGGCRWGWGRSSVNINVNRYNNFSRTTNINHHNRSRNNSNWNHNPSHRKGVNYKNSSVAGQYGGKAGTNRVTQNQARGRSGASAGTRGARAPTAGTQNRAAGAGAAKSAGASSRASSAKGSGGSRSSGSAYSGSSRPKTDRAASARGSSSRGTRSYGGSRGGGGRGGGRR